MKKIKINHRKGILFFIQGLSGSGKTVISKKIKKEISRKYGPTILISGDNLRKIFELNDYSYNGRLSNSIKFRKFSKLITNQKINLIFNVVGLMHSTRKWYRKNIDNYIEIFVKADLKKIIKFKKKKIYHSKKNKNIVGISIKPEFPKNPHIIIKNDFKKPSNYLAKLLIEKINLLIKN